MILFFFKPIIFNPIIFIVSKLSNSDENIKLEGLTHEIFQILIDQNVANEENILIFSIIQDYEKTTQNLILPSTKSNKNITNKCVLDKNFVNSLITQTLIKSDCNFYLEITDNKIKLHENNISLAHFSNYYSFS